MRFFLLFAALTMGLNAYAQDSKKIIYSDDPDTQRIAETLWRVADTPEPDGKFTPKRLDATPGVHRTPFGLQVDPHCWEVAGAKTKTDIDRWKENFDKYVRKSVDQVMGDCWSNYPELGAYINEWARRLSRTLVSCTELSQNTINAGAYNVDKIDTLNLGERKDEPPRLTKAELERLKGFKDSPNDTLKSGKPVIILPKEIAGAAGSSFSIYNLNDTLIHEGFHSTVANNLTDHNDVERKPRSDECGKNSSVDRVCVISSLCTGDPLPHHDFGESAQKVLYNRMGKCSRDMACERTFKNEYYSDDGSYKGKIDPFSRGLMKDSAGALCDKIFNEGCCREFMNTPGGAKHILSRPEITKVTKKVLKRMDAVLPKKANHIPAEAIKSYADIYDNFKSLERSECFQAFFEGDVETGLYLKGAPDKSLTDDERWADGFNWAQALKIASQKIERGKDCHDNAHVEWLQLSLARLSERVGAALDSSTFRDQIRPRKREGKERAMSSWDEPRTAESDNIMRLLDGKSKLESLAGPSLYWDYWKVLNRYHPKSKYFNCASLSIAEYGMLGCFGKLKKEPDPFCETD